MAIWEHDHEILTSYRQNPERWLELACLGATDEQNMWHDNRVNSRYRMLIALQYDLQPDDYELVRFLLEQEILRHRQQSFQGIYPAIELGVYLLATYRIVANVWLFYEALLSNFDTYLGIPRLPLVSAGIKETLEYIQSTEHQYKDDVVKSLINNGQSVRTEDELAQWWADQRKKFPVHERDETAETMARRALLFEDYDTAQYWVDLWEASVPRTPNMLYLLVSYRQQLGDWERAIAAQRENIQISEHSMQFHAVLKLSELYRMADQNDIAWETIQEAEKMLEENELLEMNPNAGRYLLVAGLEIVQGLPEAHPLIRIIFAWAFRSLLQGSTVSLQLLRLAEEAASKLDDTAAFEWLLQREEEEKKRLNW